MRREVKMLWVMVWFYALLNCGLMVFNANQHQEDKAELVKINKELMQMLVKKDAELITAKNDLNEAHEVMGELFLEAMKDRQLFNELKKQKCKGRR